MTSIEGARADDSIARRVGLIHQRIAEAAKNAGRLAGEIDLLAVSKGHSAASIRAAHQAGLNLFAENYLSEALPKMAALADLPLCWHFVGAVQSNKTAELAAHFDWLQSLDRLKIAGRLASQRPAGLPPLNVCVQVNLHQEAQKGGVSAADAEGLCRQVTQWPQLKLRGLMNIPKQELKESELRQSFQALVNLHRQIAQALPAENLDVLSIGMSADFEAAIVEGSTMIRVGTALFGLRK